ncbi:MAG: DUF1360 domain-containing protein [Thermoanaerobaculia bacterium]
MHDIYWLLLGVLAVWRVTHVLHAEGGPGRLLDRLRRSAAQTFWGRLLDCFYCLSLWIALPGAWFIGSGVDQRLFLWLALSGGAILIERVTDRQVVVPAPYVEGERSE